MKKLWRRILALMPLTQPQFVEPATFGNFKIFIGRLPDPELEYCDIYLVNGDWIKRKLEMDFIEGSNFRVPDRSFIPPGEVWIDGRMEKHEFPFVLYHEIIETRLMFLEGLSYNDAHEIANLKEKEFREFFSN